MIIAIDRIACVMPEGSPNWMTFAAYWFSSFRSSFQVKNILHFFQPDHAQDSRNQLGDDRSQCHAVDAHAEFCHEQQVQHNIDDRRYEKVGESGHGIAESPQNAAQNIIIGKTRRADKKNQQVGVAPVDNGFRCF